MHEPSAAPHHVAIIPDGNRRWANARKLQPWLGHQAAVSNFRTMLQAAFGAGTTYVTFWAASPDNMTKRSTVETSFLMLLLRQELENPTTVQFFLDNQVHVTIVGEWKEIITDEKLLATIHTIETLTQNFTDRHLTILFCYDGKAEMLGAIKKLQETRSEVTETNLLHTLWTGQLPPVDLVIRSGGEPHWSAGFMMWLTANSQFYFTETLWPDFNPEELVAAFTDYANRDRRFGK